MIFSLRLRRKKAWINTNAVILCTGFLHKSLPLACSQIDGKYLQQHGRHPPMSNAAIYGCPMSFRADSYASALALERLFSTWTRARRLIGC
jgi:hypothetical protein